MGKTTAFIHENPGFLGAAIAMGGLVILIGAILKWKWIVGPDYARVRTGVIGYAFYKLFGRRLFFIVVGALVFLGGITWVIAMDMLMPR